MALPASDLKISLIAKGFFGMKKVFLPLLCATALCASLVSANSARADDGTLNSWLNTVTRVQSQQPAWVAPLATTTPLLVQQFRYDAQFQHSGNGLDATLLGGGKGLELVLPTDTELQISVPPYVDKNSYETLVKGKIKTISPVDGFNDWPLLTLKQRLAGGNAQNGDYVVTALLTVQAPIGIRTLTNHAWVISPGIGAGKGFGPFVAQATSTVSLPLEEASTVGKTWNNNVALQYHALKYFWPEVELNETTWFDGSTRDGKNQLFATFGAVIGKIPLGQRLGIALGAGYQTALGPNYRAKPLLPTYNDGWILSARLVF
jgi:hypothetical protein